MKDLIYSSDEEFYINGTKLSGVQGVRGQYSIPTVQNNFLGYNGPVDIIQNAPGRATFSVKKTMFTSDEEITDLIGEVSFNGGLKYNGKKLGFKSGCLTSYGVNFSVDRPVESSFSVNVYGDMGSKTVPYTGTEVTGDLFKNFYSLDSFILGLDPKLKLKPGDFIRLENSNFDYSNCGGRAEINWNNKDYQVADVFSDKYGLANTIVFNHGKNVLDSCGGLYVGGGVVSKVTSGSNEFIPTTSGISVECDGRTTNRVTNVSYNVQVTKSPIYKIGSYEPCQITSMKPIKTSLAFQLDVDDYETKEVYDSIKTGIHEKTLHIKARDKCDPSRFVKYTISGAHLISEEIFASNDNETTVNLKYESYTNNIPLIEYDSVIIR